LIVNHAAIFYGRLNGLIKSDSGSMLRKIKMLLTASAPTAAKLHQTEAKTEALAEWPPTHREKGRMYKSPLRQAEHD
jgi:hypothetical protein